MLIVTKFRLNLLDHTTNVYSNKMLTIWHGCYIQLPAKVNGQAPQVIHNCSNHNIIMTALACHTNHYNVLIWLAIPVSPWSSSHCSAFINVHTKVLWIYNPKYTTKNSDNVYHLRAKNGMSCVLVLAIIDGLPILCNIMLSKNDECGATTIILASLSGACSPIMVILWNPMRNQITRKTFPNTVSSNSLLINNM